MYHVVILIVKVMQGLFSSQRWASAAVATVPLSDPVPHLVQEPTPSTRKPPEEVRVGNMTKRDWKSKPLYTNGKLLPHL